MDVQARGLSKRFGDALAVDDLSFDVPGGQVTSFLGPNGAGKTTTMRLMLGLEDGGGATSFDGRPYAALRRPAATVGVLLDARAVHPTRTARDHLRTIAVGSGVAAERVGEVLELVGMTSAADDQPRTYSLGMHQRLGLAAALLGRPRVLVLDEPANGLDPEGMAWLRGFLRTCAAEGTAVLVSSHVLSEVEAVADRVVVVGSGRLISQDTVAGFVRSFGLSVVGVRSTEPARLAAALERAGGQVERSGESLSVRGLEQRGVAEVAFTAGCLVYELTTSTDNLEQSFLRAATDHTEHRAGVAA